MKAALRYLTGMVAGIALGAAVWGVFVGQFVGVRIEGNVMEISEWYALKSRIAREMPSPKLILAGGSGVFYGLSAGALAEEYGVDAVNYGTHAGLALDYLLYRVKKITEPGDMIVLALEYEFYPEEGELGLVSVEYLLGADPAYIRRLDSLRQVTAFYGVDAVKWLRMRELSPEQLSQATTKYRAETRQMMNAHGDRTGHTRASMTERIRNRMAGVSGSKALERPELRQQQYVWRKLAAFAKWCAENDVTLVATYPNTLDNPALHSATAQENLRWIQEQFATLGIPLLGTPEMGFLPREDFYDTAYHLNEEGQQAHTARMAETLRPAVEKWKSGRRAAQH